MRTLFDPEPAAPQRDPREQRRVLTVSELNALVRGVIVEAMEPAGLGALQLAFEQLKARLQAEGLFEAARRRPLPLLPRRLGIVTSPSGAALRDILRVLGRRFANLEVVIAPARVQGDGA